MNRSNGWAVRQLLGVHIAVLLLLASWLFEPVRGLWLAADNDLFHLFDDSLKQDGEWWRLFWALMNHEWFDYLVGLALLSPFFLSAAAAGRDRWAWHLAIVTMAVIAAFIGTRIGNWMPIDRYSATLVFPDAFHLSKTVNFKTKDYSDDTFPGDHGIVGFIIAGFALRYLTGGHRWAVVAFGVLYVIPRLVAGAHWLSDELVGAVFVCGLVLAWFFYTPLAALLTVRLEKMWHWLLCRMALS